MRVSTFLRSTTIGGTIGVLLFESALACLVLLIMKRAVSVRWSNLDSRIWAQYMGTYEHSI
jgi:hypothetical protein